MQRVCSVGHSSALTGRQLRARARGSRAPNRQVLYATASAQKSGSPLLEGLVAEGIITAEEAATCSPEQLEALIRKRFRPDASPEQTSIQAYVAEGILTQDELEKCTPDQLEFLIRKRSGSPPAVAIGKGSERRGATNVVPFGSPKDMSPSREPVNGGVSISDKAVESIEAYIAEGLVTKEEAEKYAPQQLEFLARKRSPSPPAKREPRAAAAPAAPAPPKLKPTQPNLWPKEPAKKSASLEPQNDVDFVQLSLEEYLTQGIVSEYEIESCTPEQLAFLIRKRLTLAAAAAQSGSEEPIRGRSRGPVERRGATVPAAAAAAAAPLAEEETPRKLVVPRAPPLTDSEDGRSPPPVARTAVGAAGAGQEDTNWAGVAVAGLTVVGLSAGLYFAGPRTNNAPPTETTAVQRSAPAGADAVKLADKEESKAGIKSATDKGTEKGSASTAATAAKESAVKPSAPQAAAQKPDAAAQLAAQKAAPAPPPPPAAKVESKKEEAAPPPAAATKVEEKKPAAPAPPPPAPAATATAPNPEPKSFMSGMHMPSLPGMHSTPKADEKKEMAASAAAAAKQQEEAASKPDSKKMAQQLAAQLKTELEEKQAPAKKAPAKQQSTGSNSAASVNSVGLAFVGIGAAAVAALVLPGARNALAGRFGGEAAALKAANARFASLQRLVETQQGDLKQCQEQLSVAQAEYGQALAKLNSAKGALEGLVSRVESSERAARALVSDLEKYPSKEAQRLKAEADKIANSVTSQRMAVDKALQRALKDL